MTLTATLVACGSGERGDTRAGRVPYWVEGVGFAHVAEESGIDVPAAASERRGARQVGFQGDVLLLAFVLPDRDVNGFIAALAPQDPLVHRERAVADPAGFHPTTPFGHLGLPEPETLDGVLAGPVCAPCAGKLDELEVVVAPLGGGRSRVYLRGVD
ncbi:MULTISPECIES: hypothetical protein [Streptomyces]|uniref:Lipoprotein n=1 Tax=Streptomyces griseosporeus TaxID=1910 RepID=A0ABV3KMT4_STRGS|nr:hypothetical protein [Streptomyces actuosus]MBM4824575.1 hypothetical protein [Streptomyces actuosus]